MLQATTIGRIRAGPTAVGLIGAGPTGVGLIGTITMSGGGSRGGNVE